MNTRLAALRQRLVEENLDAILVTQPENRRYLSGFTGSAGVLLISAERAIMATDFRYYEQVGRQCPDFELARITDKFEDLLPDLLREAGGRRIGFESEHLTFHYYQQWSELLGNEFELVPTRALVEGLRMVKDEAELACLRQAVALADMAYAHILDFIRPGMREKDVAWELEVYMRTHGGDKVAFDIIVAGGPNGAMPHARATERLIQEGEPIVMDLGVQVGGYNSDLSRTLCLGQGDGRFQEIYGLVLEAQLAAEGAIEAGMEGKEADAVARRVIEEAGYGEYFGHGLGHGVGLAVHEKPTAGRISTDVLQVGNVLTVEPGIYLPDWGGVRIEDMVVVREEGVEVLTKAAK